MLVNQTPLPDKYRDHALMSTNKYYRVRECHIQPSCWCIALMKQLLSLLTQVHIQRCSKRIAIVVRKLRTYCVSSTTLGCQLPL